MKPENKTTLAFAILGVLVGYVSSVLMNSYLSLALAIAFFFIGSEAFKLMLKIKEKFGWFWTNGGWIYVFVWFIVWILFYNL